MELKKKSHDEACFCKGWEEFVKYYRMSFGFFLVFKYEGNSKFSVVIFDSSAAEIHYPCKDDNSEKQNSVSDQCGFNTSRSQRHKVEDEEEIIDIEDEKNALRHHGKSGKKDRTGKVDNSRKREKGEERSGQMQRSRSSRMKKTSLSKKQRALEAAQNFEPENPYFTAIIRPSNLNRYYMDVPAEFWKANMGKVGGAMKLEDCKGRKWEANYGKHVSSIRIGKGWIGLQGPTM